MYPPGPGVWRRRLMVAVNDDASESVSFEGRSNKSRSSASSFDWTRSFGAFRKPVTF